MAVTLKDDLARVLGRSPDALVEIRSVGALDGRTGQPTPEELRGSHSVIDVIMNVSGQNRNHSAEAFRKIAEVYQEVNASTVNFQFEGQGQRRTPVAKIAAMVEIIMLLPGRTAALVRRQCAEVFVRYLGGDLRLIEEVTQLRHVQEVLAREDPDHFGRVFGRAVEESAPASDAVRQAREQLELADIDRQIQEQRRRAEEQKRLAEEQRRLAEEQRRRRVLDNLTALRDASLHVDSRMEIQARDYLIGSNLADHHLATTSATLRKEICLQTFVRSQANVASSDVQSLACRLGKAITKISKETHGDDFVPDKKMIYCNGQQIEVNCWWEDSHKDIVQQAWRLVQDQPRPARSATPVRSATSARSVRRRLA
jgi:hypothetical protein